MPAVSSVPLHDLPRGACAVIDNLHTPTEASDREVLLRLMELGFLPGEPVRVVARAGVGREPMAVRLGNLSTFALRRREAALVNVRAERAQASEAVAEVAA